MSNVIAKVNGHPLTVGDIDPYLWDWRHKEVEQDFINYLMVKTAADAAGISVTPEEVQSALDAFLKRYQATLRPGQTLADALDAQGSSQSRLFLREESQLLLKKLMLKGFSSADYVKVSTVIFGGPADKGDLLAQDLKKANDAYSSLQKGGSWKAALAQGTTHPGADNPDGSLGWRPKSVFPKDARDQFAGLAPGGFTKPEQTPFGVQIFRLDELGANAKGQDASDLATYFLDSNRTSFLQQLRQRTKIERY